MIVLQFLRGCRKTATGTRGVVSNLTLYEVELISIFRCEGHFCSVPTKILSASSRLQSNTAALLQYEADGTQPNTADCCWPYTSCSQHVLLSLSRTVQNTHVVRAEPYDREVVAVVQFHSWYHLDALHATLRNNSCSLACRRQTADRKRAQPHCALKVTHYNRRTHTATYQIVCSSFSLSLSRSFSLSNLYFIATSLFCLA